MSSKPKCVLRKHASLVNGGVGVVDVNAPVIGAGSRQGVKRCLLLAVLCAAAACASGSTDGLAIDSQTSTANAGRISQGMQRLGATQSRGSCFGDRIAQTLDGRRQDEAARVVEEAGSKGEMRDRVLSASRPVRKAFIGASMSCTRES
ncbi:MAG: hypothetical protein WD076_00715 [Parvularculaceae bacterium]